ncbi:MAG: Flp family type IVb pilin [Pseudomonadota bacterium]
MNSQSLTRRNLLFGKASSSPTDEANEDISLVADESGATAIEYSLIAAIVSLTIFNAVRRTGRRSRRSMNCTHRTLNRARRGRPAPGCAG